ncbi:hypothetical protein J8273_0292 [Carpediemonas membranifera]|uniref:Uncharacterized protein n=1 Tax=Carpediemonas membranifera TaxID=201153 RepID=A0A8J6BZ10_9EUKA|nr:hypothetical protein J8273_0292 [Carpediemonas membranifera]|eukprot:KAG9395076.1 hypothetical protein J8273_0292 [Carpediemonas membranifera]
MNANSDDSERISANHGTAEAPYVPQQGEERMFDEDADRVVIEEWRHSSISAMPQYCSDSLVRLRYMDYCRSGPRQGQYRAVSTALVQPQLPLSMFAGSHVVRPFRPPSPDPRTALHLETGARFTEAQPKPSPTVVKPTRRHPTSWVPPRSVRGAEAETVWGATGAA